MSSFDCYKQLNVNRGFGQVIMSNLAHDSLPTKFDDKHLFPGVLHIIANNFGHCYFSYWWPKLQCVLAQVTGSLVLE